MVLSVTALARRPRMRHKRGYRSPPSCYVFSVFARCRQGAPSVRLRVPLPRFFSHALVFIHELVSADDHVKHRTVVLLIVHSDADGDTDLYHADLKGAAAIVIGNEGQGMSRLVAESCDQLVRIPMKGNISSLNASAAASILLYEAVRQRG